MHDTKRAQLCFSLSLGSMKPSLLISCTYREAVIGALLELLEYEASNAEEQSKFKDLTVKCLIKVTKSLDDDIKTDRVTRGLVTVSVCCAPVPTHCLCEASSLSTTWKESLLHRQVAAPINPEPLRSPYRGVLPTLQALDLNRILLAIHGYFSSMTSQEIKARGLQEDKPLRMAKTLLHKICGLAVCLQAPHLHPSGHSSLTCPETESHPLRYEGTHNVGELGVRWFSQCRATRC